MPPLFELEPILPTEYRPRLAGHGSATPGVLRIEKYAKKYLKESRVPFREVNVERDASAARTIQKQTGQTGVPVIKIGSKWIVGFDQSAIERELARRS